MLLVVKPNWAGQFHRSLASRKGKRIGFAVAEPVEVTRGEVGELARDIGKALVFCRYDQKHRLRYDYDATDAFVKARDESGGDITQRVKQAISAVEQRGTLLESLDEGDLLVVDSEIHPQYHPALLKARLVTLQEIGAFLDKGGKLVDLDGIAEPGEQHILDAIGMNTEDEDSEDDPENKDNTPDPLENVTTPDGQTPIVGSALPPNFQRVLVANELATFEQIQQFLDDGGELTKFEGIAEKGAKIIEQVMNTTLTPTS